MPSTPTRPACRVLGISGLDATSGDPESVAAGLNRLLGRSITTAVAMSGEAAADRVDRTLAEEGLALDRLDRLNNQRSAIVPVGITRLRSKATDELGVDYTRVDKTLERTLAWFCEDEALG